MRTARDVIGLRVAPVFLVAVAGLAAAGQEARQQQPTFRAATDLVLIDTQVVAGDGTPVGGLTADRFTVHIDGRRRPVVSAEFVRSSASVPAAPGEPAEPGTAPVPGGRVIVLAVDEASFPVVAQAAAREAATRVVDRVAADDYLGLVTFPGHVQVAPTREHRLVREAIPRITGARVDAPSTSRFRLSASEAAVLRSRAPVAAKEIIDRECGREWPPNPSCPQEVMEDAHGIATALEQQGMLTIDGLHGVLDALAPVPGRKTLVVISAGLPMSRWRGGKPDLEAETDRIARRAAAANLNLYVLYLNVHFLHVFSPAYGKVNYSLYDDITMFGYGLERFADTGGGAFFQVEVDSDPFVDRALRETSAWYLLAVRTDPRERDGRAHVIRVTVDRRGATVRHRRVVVIPAAGR